MTDLETRNQSLPTRHNGGVTLVLARIDAYMCSAMQQRKTCLSERQMQRHLRVTEARIGQMFA